MLRGVSLEVNSGELLAMLGANGAGKSTLMRSLSGLLRPVGGQVLLLGRDVSSFAAHEVVRAGLVLVPEGRQVFPELSVEDNIRLGAHTRRDFQPSEVDAMLKRRNQFMPHQMTYEDVVLLLAQSTAADLPAALDSIGLKWRQAVKNQTVK